MPLVLIEVPVMAKTRANVDQVPTYGMASPRADELNILKLYKHAID